MTIYLNLCQFIHTSLLRYILRRYFWIFLHSSSFYFDQNRKPIEQACSSLTYWKLLARIFVCHYFISINCLSWKHSQLKGKGPYTKIGIFKCLKFWILFKILMEKLTIFKWSHISRVFWTFSEEIRRNRSFDFSLMPSNFRWSQLEMSSIGNRIWCSERP